ncbi:MAG: T9SS C-terminal target domain-containing protein [Calditrichaeota bacterium]|nr:MAG: T9SS C-terminal target domain-containing protein [Calditrichota bacterium]
MLFKIMFPQLTNKKRRVHWIVTSLLITISTLLYPQAQITVNPSITYQTISGWEGTTEIGQTVFPNLYQAWEDSVIKLLVNDLGINRVRLSIRSGSENPVDYFAQYFYGQISYGEWRSHRHEIINDNNDPNVIDTSGFQFTELDIRIEHIVNPMRSLLAERGEQLYVNLNVVDFAGDQGNSNVQFQDEPEEYAEFILAVFQHIEPKYGWIPDGVEVILEPDLADWGNGTAVGNALVATGNKLLAHGYSPDFIVPSTSDMGLANSWFDQLIQVPGALSFVSEISYHRYGGVSNSNLQGIAQRAQQYNIGSAMLEHIGSSYPDLHKDLKIGLNTAWQQFTLAFPNPSDFGGDNGAQYYWIDISDTNNIQILIGERTKFLRQYFKFIRRGAVRIEANSNDNDFDPLAFINPDGNYVVVVKANGGGSFTVTGLPEGTYSIKYTTQNEYNVDLPDITISNGESLTTNIPHKGVITIYKRTNSPNAIDPPVGVSSEFILYQNYPNPFNPETTIRYRLLQKSPVQLSIINTLGQTVAVLVDSTQTPGNYRVNWNASHVPSGLYFCRLSTRGNTQVIKMLLIK